ncbi:putative membrane protein, contains bPH2 (bacterial pleckstrin homology) domain [Halanaeroarchaeum sp. HSR-CO]|uniref:PH domain-containing protein n=1 Tax=Halanaeroarchaeum sp. HSR-CO TaxID=2866382 RepID=UPI00217E72F1|nr:PH domain-containing protein [Halanaeroarchaeum sp. HSR-CO]UWG47562.1 putative membrane protein, contains bPH2 (bacterial pleckstrin homology) domain [Halanaeroarchaeum sp. HSR-CO]
MSEPSTIDPETADWLTLDEDEEIVWSGKPHESSLIPALVVGVPLAIVLVGIFIIAGSYLQRENTQYVVTTDGLYKKTGVLSRDVQRIDFGKVQNTSYSQGFFGSRFGYGNVDISTAGGSGIEMQFRAVPEPREVQERINKRVKGSRGEPTTESGETKRDVLDDILVELREIHTTLETQQESAGASTATASNIGTASDEQSAGDDDTSQNATIRSNQKDENSTADQASDDGQ